MPVTTDRGIAWVSGQGGTRGSSVLEFASECHPSNTSPEPGDEVLVLFQQARGNDSIWIDMGAPVMRAIEPSHTEARDGYASSHLLYQDLVII
jgi:hypothetical protein